MSAAYALPLAALAVAIGLAVALREYETLGSCPGPGRIVTETLGWILLGPAILVTLCVLAILRRRRRGRA